MRPTVRDRDPASVRLCIGEAPIVRPSSHSSRHVDRGAHISPTTDVAHARQRLSTSRGMPSTPERAGPVRVAKEERAVERAARACTRSWPRARRAGSIPSSISSAHSPACRITPSATSTRCCSVPGRRWRSRASHDEGEKGPPLVPHGRSVTRPGARGLQSVRVLDVQGDDAGQRARGLEKDLLRLALRATRPRLTRPPAARPHRPRQGAAAGQCAFRATFLRRLHAPA
jgi:hypothetical protein